MKNILEVKKLRKSFKNFTLNDISFTLPRGYIMGFIGPNGAGKSTTIKLIMNLLKRRADRSISLVRTISSMKRKSRIVLVLYMMKTISMRN